MDTTIESDSKQKRMSGWNRTESGSSSTNREIQAPHSIIEAIIPTRRSVNEEQEQRVFPP